MNILCLLGFHKEKHTRETVFKDRDFETVNTIVTCERCGILIDEYGTTHFSLRVLIPKDGL